MTVSKTSKLLPVFLTFILMGFVDIVGVSTGYVQQDFNLSDPPPNFFQPWYLVGFSFFPYPLESFRISWEKEK